MAGEMTASVGTLGRGKVCTYLPRVDDETSDFEAPFSPGKPIMEEELRMRWERRGTVSYSTEETGCREEGDFRAG